MPRGEALVGPVSDLRAGAVGAEARIPRLRARGASMRTRFVARGRFAEFGEDAERALGVDERDPHVMRTRPGCLVDHPQPRLLQLGDPGLDVLDGEGDVVEPLAPLVQEGRDRAGRVGRFQQFEPDVADPEEPDADFLGGDLLDVLEDRPEGALIERPMGLDGADRDSDVVDGFDGGHVALLWANVDTGGEFISAVGNRGFLPPGYPILPRLRPVGRRREFATSVNVGFMLSDPRDDLRG